MLRACVGLERFWYICSPERVKPNHILLKQHDKS
jgi:hypothetical protein